MRPSSTSVIAQAAVIGLVVEEIRKIDRRVTGRFVSRSSTPAVPLYTSPAWATSHTSPGTAPDSTGPAIARRNLSTRCDVSVRTSGLASVGSDDRRRDRSSRARGPRRPCRMGRCRPRSPRRRSPARLPTTRTRCCPTPPTRWLHTSGVVPIAPDGTVPTEIGEQATLVWTNIMAMLDEATLAPRTSCRSRPTSSTRPRSPTISRR